MLWRKISVISTRDRWDSAWIGRTLPHRTRKDAEARFYDAGFHVIKLSAARITMGEIKAYVQAQAKKLKPTRPIPKRLQIAAIHKRSLNAKSWQGVSE